MAKSGQGVGYTRRRSSTPGLQPNGRPIETLEERTKREDQERRENLAKLPAIGGVIGPQTSSRRGSAAGRAAKAARKASMTSLPGLEGGLPLAGSPELASPKVNRRSSVLSLTPSSLQPGAHDSSEHVSLSAAEAILGVARFIVLFAPGVSIGTVALNYAFFRANTLRRRRVLLLQLLTADLVYAMVTLFYIIWVLLVVETGLSFGDRLGQAAVGILALAVTATKTAVHAVYYGLYLPVEAEGVHGMGSVHVPHVAVGIALFFTSFFTLYLIMLFAYLALAGIARGQGPLYLLPSII